MTRLPADICMQERNRIGVRRRGAKGPGEVPGYALLRIAHTGHTSDLGTLPHHGFGTRLPFENTHVFRQPESGSPPIQWIVIAVHHVNGDVTLGQSLHLGTELHECPQAPVSRVIQVPGQYDEVGMGLDRVVNDPAECPERGRLEFISERSRSIHNATKWAVQMQIGRVNETKTRHFFIFLNVRDRTGPMVRVRNRSGVSITRAVDRKSPNVQRLHGAVPGACAPELIDSTMPTLILLRHGQSTWNLENRFTGWTDVPLTDLGAREAQLAGQLIRDAGYLPNFAFTSVLKRAIKTLWLALEEMDLMWIPVERSWRLNERHYGSLQGSNKMETVEKYGAEQVHIWRRSYDIPPPPLDRGDARNPANDPRYSALVPDQVPLTESLERTVDRVIPYWHERIATELRTREQILVVSHGNSLRALIKYLDGISDEDIVSLNIPTGVPLVYALDNSLRPTHSAYLGDPEAVARATQAVRDQTQEG